MVDELMQTFGRGLVEMAQERMDSAVTTYAKMATVTGRDTTGPLAQVSFYGSDGGLSDVKCPEGLIVAPGDLVGLVKYEHDWIITVNYTGRSLADAVGTGTWVSLQQTTTTTYIDMPGSPGLAYVKMRDVTMMRFSLQLSASGSNLANVIDVALHVTSDDGVTDYVEPMTHMKTTNGGEHDHFTGHVQAASAHPAGGYSAVVQWKRVSGTGFIQVDADDRLFVQVREVWA